jgi:diguanylate cyclase (GGDEF)-like protein/putative nucleotidyltransferase with HDIG domain
MKRLRGAISSWGNDRLRAVEERALAARIGGLLWLGFAATLLLTPLVPGTRLQEVWLVGVVAAVAVAGGVAVLALVRRQRAPALVAHLSAILAVVAVAAVAPLTGGAASPADEYLWFVIAYAGFFFTARQAAGYWLGCSLVHALPLLYDGGAVQANLVRELLVVVPTYAIVCALLVAGRDLLTGLSVRAAALEHEQRRLAEEHSSLGRVATAVAAGSPPQAIFTLVSSEAGRLLAADGAGIARYVDDRRVQVMGNWSPTGQARTEPGQFVALQPDDELVRLRTAGKPIRVDHYGESASSVAHALGYRSFVAAPVHAGNALWGVLAVTARRPGAFPRGAEDRLREYAELMATAVANAEDRARLHSHAGIDPLTDLPNARAFRAALEDEVSRARRHARPLTVAVVDVDRFRALTDRVGDDEGDATLVEIASLLRAAVRDEDLIARLGADQFGLAFVESDRVTALRAAERARDLVRSTPLRHGKRVTVSIGLCDLDAAGTPDELLQRADAALFWSKQHGRDRSWLYDRSVVGDVAGHARRYEVDRERGLAGLRALARAIDAKDPATQEHSERVAALAGRLAAVRGWDKECVERLREAAILHDVGKIGVPDAALLKAGPLDEAETALMREHAALGARIVGDALDERQVAWIAAHHERPDGTGYPIGLRGDEIPEGATLLALADAWDSMACDRVYRARRPIEEALAECRALAGRQFTPAAVDALETLYHRGELTRAATRLHRPTPEPV